MRMFGAFFPEWDLWPSCVRVILCLGFGCHLVTASFCSLMWMPNLMTCVRFLQCVWRVYEDFPIYVKMISNLMAILMW